MNIFNRALWIVLAAVVCAVGVVGFIAGHGYLGEAAERFSATTADVGLALRPTSTVQLIGAGAAVVAIVLGIILLRIELEAGPPTSFPDFHLSTATPQRGITNVRSVALRHGLQHDLERISGVERVGISLVGHPSSPRLQFRIQAAGSPDMAELRRAVATCVDRFARTLGSPVAGGEVIMSFSHQNGRRLS